MTPRFLPDKKRGAARYLQRGLGLDESDKPIVACVTRLVPQKVCPAAGGP